MPVVEVTLMYCSIEKIIVGCEPVIYIINSYCSRIMINKKICTEMNQIENIVLVMQSESVITRMPSYEYIYNSMLRMTLFYTCSVWVWGTKHKIKIMNLLENSKEESEH